MKILSVPASRLWIPLAFAIIPLLASCEHTEQKTLEPEPEIPEIGDEEYAVYDATLEWWLAFNYTSQQVVLADSTDSREVRWLVKWFDNSLKSLRESFPDLETETLTDLGLRNDRDYFLEGRFGTDITITMLTAQESHEIFGGPTIGWSEFYRRYPRSPGVTSLSRVGINDSGDQALVFLNNWCGGLCGWGLTLFLVKEQDGWVVVDFVERWIS